MDKKDRHLTFFIEGTAEHSGRVLADEFVQKLAQFLKTIREFDRSFNGQEAMEVELVDIERRNPYLATARFVSRITETDNVSASRFADWYYNQVEAIASGREVDGRVTDQAVEAVVKFGKEKKGAGYSRAWIAYDEERPIAVNDDLSAKAIKVRDSRRDSAKFRWPACTSFGRIVGELRDVRDSGGEKEFVIVSPGTRKLIKCHFDDSQREKIGENLFKTVTITGMVTYGNGGPTPTKVEVKTIDEVPEGPALLSLGGLFDGAVWDGIDFNVWGEYDA